MEILYNSKGIDTYLDVALGDISNRENIGVEYKIKMLQENNIPYLIKPVAIEEDGRLWMKFNTNSVYVLERLFSYVRPDGNLLRIIFGQLMSVIDILGQFFLRSEELLVDPKYMFYDGEKKEIRLLYIPGYNKKIGIQLKEFLEYVMKLFDYRDRDGVSFMYQIYELLLEEKLSVELIKKYIKDNSCGSGQIQERLSQNYEIVDMDISVEEAKIISTNKLLKKDFTWHEPVLVINGIFVCVFLSKYFAFGKNEGDIVIGILLLAAMILHGLFYFGKEDYYDIDEDMEEHLQLSDKVNDKVLDETSLHTLDNCNASSQEITRLIPLTNGALDEILLEQKNVTFLVGRGKRENNYRIPTTQISRVHADICKNVNGVFIEDKGSTNGTFVNSCRINAYEKVKINRGDIISFANQEFFVS